MKTSDIIIEEEIVDILREVFEKNIKVSEALIKMHLFSHQIRLSYIEMTYLCSILEQTYKISFLSDDFDDDSFYTIEGLAKLVSVRTKEKRN